LCTLIFGIELNEGILALVKVWNGGCLTIHNSPFDERMAMAIAKCRFPMI